MRQQISNERFVLSIPIGYERAIVLDFPKGMTLEDYDFFKTIFDLTMPRMIQPTTADCPPPPNPEEL